MLLRICPIHIPGHSLAPAKSPITGSSHGGSSCMPILSYHGIPYPFSLMLAKVFKIQSRNHRDARNTVNNRLYRLISHTHKQAVANLASNA
jgi:hypothetical protein